jgi:hypothetical protein
VSHPSSDLGDQQRGTSANPSAGDVLPPYSEAVEHVTKLRQYFRTRQRVLAGEHLWDRSKAELQAAQLMEPWRFNVYQSVLSAAPAIVLGVAWGFVGPEQNAVPKSEFDVDRGAEFASTILGLLLPLLAPFSLAITSHAAARGSLERTDITPDALARSRRAYLYLDGALGLWSQMLLASVFWLGWFAFQAKAAWLAVLSAPCFLLAFIFQARVTHRVIPARLFALNGYPSSYPRFFHLSDPNRKRWSRYWSLTHTRASFAVAGIAVCFFITALVGGEVLVVIQDRVKALWK